MLCSTKFITQLGFSIRSTALTIFAMLLLIGGSHAGCAPEEGDADSGQATPPVNTPAGIQPTAPPTETVYISAEFEAWSAETNEIVKHVDDVFVGTIRSAGETFSRYGRGDVWTPYTVEVEQRLLGNVEGTITVVQHGGYDPDRDILFVLPGVPLLEVGETYMLATTTGRECRSCRDNIEGEHVVQNGGKGHIRIQDDAHRQELIQEYSEAIDQAGLGS